MDREMEHYSIDKYSSILQRSKILQLPLQTSQYFSAFKFNYAYIATGITIIAGPVIFVISSGKSN